MLWCQAETSRTTVDMLPPGWGRKWHWDTEHGWEGHALWRLCWAAELAMLEAALHLAFLIHELNIYLWFMSWGFGVLLLKASCLILWVYLREFSLHKENPDVHPVFMQPSSCRKWGRALLRKAVPYWLLCIGHEVPLYCCCTREFSCVEAMDW